MTTIVIVVQTEPRPRFGENVRPKTMYGIESVVEFVEQAEKPFTAMDVWRGSRASWSTMTKTLYELRDRGLIRRVTPERAQPGKWLAIDKELPQ